MKNGKAEYGLLNATDTTLEVVLGRMALKPDNYMYLRPPSFFFLQQCKYGLSNLLTSLTFYWLSLTKEKWIYQIIMITWQALSNRDIGQV